MLATEMPQSAKATLVRPKFNAFVPIGIDRGDRLGLFARCKGQLVMAGELSVVGFVRHCF